MLHLRCPSLALYLISSFLSVFCSIRPVAATPVTSLAIILNTIPAELIPAATVPSEPVRSRFPGVEPSKNLPPPPCDVSRVSFTTEARIEDPFYHLRKIVDYLQYCDLTREGWEGEEEERAGRVKRPLVSIVNFLAWNEDKSGWEEAYTKKYRSFERRTAQQHEEAFGSFSREEASDKGGLNIFQSTFEQSRHTELKFYDGFYAMVSAETNTAQYLRGVDLGRQIYTDKK